MRFVAENPFFFEVGFVVAGLPLSQVPGALPLGSDDGEGTDFDAEENAFEAVVSVVDLVTVAAMDSPNAALFEAEDGSAIAEKIADEEKCAAEDAFVPEIAFETDGACADEEYDADEGPIMMRPSYEVRVRRQLLPSLASLPSPRHWLSSMAKRSRTEAIAAAVLPIEGEVSSFSKASEDLLFARATYPWICVM